MARKLAFALIVAASLLIAPIALTLPSTDTELGPNNGKGKGPHGGQGDPVTVQLNLTGVATRTNGGPDSDFVFWVNVTGDGYEKAGNPNNGQGAQVWARGLQADVLIVRASNGAEAENFTVLVDLHAQRSSCMAQGDDDGCFKFGLRMTGPKGEKVVRNNNSAERIHQLNVHGDTQGLPDENGTFAVVGHGQTTTQPGGNGPAQHFNLNVTGTGSIGPDDEDGGVLAAAVAMPQSILRVAEDERLLAAV